MSEDSDREAEFKCLEPRCPMPCAVSLAPSNLYRASFNLSQFLTQSAHLASRIA
jgi:hypothetical protein